MLKKNLRKGLVAALAGMMTLAALSGCGNKEEGTNTVTTTQSEAGGSSSTGGAGTGSGALTMTWWGNQVRNERTQAALDKYTELNSGVTIEGQFFQWDDYWSKLATSAAGKKMPDLVQMDMAYIDQYVGKGQLLDLTPYIESGALDVSNVAENIQQMGVIDGKTYGFAAGVNAPALFYNKTLLEENGFEMKDNMTIEEFIILAKEIYEKTGYRANLVSRFEYMTCWARANDISITEPKMGAETADQYQAFFDILEQGIAEGWHVSGDFAPSSSATEEDPMVYGSSPETMTWCTLNGGSNMLTAFQNAAPEGTEIGITTQPTLDPQKSNYLKPSMLFSISAETSNPEQAVAVLNYLINSTEANEILLGERGIPANAQIAEAILPFVSESEKNITKFVNDVVSPNCSPMDPPAPEGSSEVTDLLTKLVEKVGYGEYTSEQAAIEYFEKGNAIFSEKQ